MNPHFFRFSRFGCDFPGFPGQVGTLDQYNFQTQYNVQCWKQDNLVLHKFQCQTCSAAKQLVWSLLLHLAEDLGLHLKKVAPKLWVGLCIENQWELWSPSGSASNSLQRKFFQPQLSARYCQWPKCLCYQSHSCEGSPSTNTNNIDSCSTSPSDVSKLIFAPTEPKSRLMMAGCFQDSWWLAIFNCSVKSLQLPVSRVVWLQSDGLWVLHANVLLLIDCCWTAVPVYHNVVLKGT